MAGKLYVPQRTDDSQVLSFSLQGGVWRRQDELYRPHSHLRVVDHLASALPKTDWGLRTPTVMQT